MDQKLRVYCEKHNRWEFYSLGDLICGSATSASGEGGIFKSETWAAPIPLKDTKGNPVYPGDIISTQFHKKPAKVELSFYELHDTADIPCFCAGGLVLTTACEIEILGNIFDNPDLISK